MSTKTCTKCRGTGWAPVAENGGTKRRCECVTRELAARRLDAAGIPDRYHEKTIADYIPTTPSGKIARERCEAFVSGWPHSAGLLMVGPAGVGKTHLAVGVLRETINAGADGRFAAVYRLFRDLQRTYDGGGGGEWQVMQPLMMCDVLVIDDLGARRVTEWSHDVISELVCERYNENRPTILTTNYARELLAVRIGVRLVSRLAEVCTRVAITAPDYRLHRDEK